MKKFFLTVAAFVFAASCQSVQISGKTEPEKVSPSSITTGETSTNNELNTEKKYDNPPYPGISIDRKFPPLESHNFQEKDFSEKSFAIVAEDFKVHFKNFRPQTINKNNREIFSFKTRYSEKGEYHSSLVGMSRLLGENSRQIYVVAGGPGAVCCTNYWITEVSGEKPRNIFRSEDFGNFRDAMEIFDADNDGIYELVQYDSAFRYFMNDYGSCSPQPRAVFKYDKKSGKYLPAKGIQQDFVKERFIESEKWLAETFEKLNREKDVSLELDFNRSFLAHTVDLIYFGEENKAWQKFNKYFVGHPEKEKIRAEIKKRLSESRFYQALKSGN